MISRVMTYLDWALRWVLIALSVMMVVTVSWQVVSRYGFRAPSSLTEEIARFQLIWLGLIGSAYAFRTHMHVGIDVVVDHLPPTVKRWTERLSILACILFAFSILIIGGLKLVILTHELDQVAAATGIRMSVIYSVVPISGLLWVIYGFGFLWDSWQSPRSERKRSHSAAPRVKP